MARTELLESSLASSHNAHQEEAGAQPGLNSKNSVRDAGVPNIVKSYAKGLPHWLLTFFPSMIY